MNPRKKPVEEGSWLDTYADLVTLLMTFFVLLFSMSSIDVEKYMQFLASFGAEPQKTTISALQSEDIINLEQRDDTITDFNGQGLMVDQTDGLSTMSEGNDSPTPESPKPTFSPNPETQQLMNQLDKMKNELEKLPEYQQINQQFDKLYNTLSSYIKLEGLGDMVFIERTDDSIVMRFNDTLLFNSARADLKDEALLLLSKVGPVIYAAIDSIEVVEVEGHTDNVPINNSRYKDNWDLSAARALNAVRELSASSNIPLNKMAAIAFGEFLPIATNDTPEGRSLNRRVCFNIIRRDLLNDLMAQNDSSQVS